MKYGMDADFQTRLVERIEALARFSETADNLTRPSLTPSMRRVNDTVTGWMRGAGMSVREDAAGNLIGRYIGSDPNGKTLLLGSHLDTVRDAGKYDGTLGVLLALACVEQLSREGVRLPFAVEVIAFCDEEGLRFQPYIGSRAVAGQLSENDLLRVDENGMTLAQAMRDFGGDPSALAAARKRSDELLGYLEVHIEQGPILEASGLPVGIVSGIAGQSRLEIEFTGEAGHAGTVPMRLRRDAMAAAARLIVGVQDTARATEGLAATVGQVTVLPGVSNVIPGRAILSLDVRHMDDGVRKTALSMMETQAYVIADMERVDLRWTLNAESASIPCSPQMIGVLTEAVQRAGITPMQVASGAGHDAVMMSTITPVGMLFVRCRGGISHNPAEYADPADAEIAADVLLDAMRQLAEKADG